MHERRERPLGLLLDLDAFEGPGYVRVDEFPVSCLATHDVLRTITYVARNNVRGLQPFDWYLALVLAGMRERVQALNGTFDVKVEPGQGLKIRALIPIAGDDDD